MERSDSRLLPVVALNERRRRAVKLRLSGMKLEQVCELSELSKGVVISAVRAYQHGGWDAVAVHEHRGLDWGTGCILDEQQQQTIRGLIHAHTPDQLGLPYALWSRAAVSALIEKEYDMALPVRTVELMFSQIGDVQLPDLMLEVDAHTNFSEILLGRRAKDERELVALYAALIAHGTEIDAMGVAAMIPGLDQAQVTSAMRALETHGRLRRANECVIDFQTKHEISLLWGSGAKASSDMMSLDASRHLWNARVDPRRRTHAVGVYTHIQDRYGIIYD